jgi:hypothetical protein
MANTVDPADLLAILHFLDMEMDSSTASGGVAQALTDPLAAPLLPPLTESIQSLLEIALAPSARTQAAAPVGATSLFVQDALGGPQGVAAQDIPGPALRESLRQILKLADDGVDGGILSGVDLLLDSPALLPMLPSTEPEPSVVP